MSDENYRSPDDCARIGRWTAEMLLLFDLGRLDVWPTNDYGVRKGFAKTFRLENCRHRNNCCDG